MDMSMPWFSQSLIATTMGSRSKHDAAQGNTIGLNVPGVQKCSERSGSSERSARAEQCSERKLRFWVFQQLAKRLCPSELYRDSVQGSTVGLKSYCTVVEIHRAGTEQMLYPRSACSGSTLAQACSGSAHACSALASNPNANEARGAAAHFLPLAA